MIRQAISCDICGTEKKQTNHWFVAYDQGGELRISGWTSRNRLRPGSRHLCGQTCLHKLVDDFMAKALAVRVPPGSADEAIVADIPVANVPAYVRSIINKPILESALARSEANAPPPSAPPNTSLTTNLTTVNADLAALDPDFESSARLVPSLAPSVIRRPPLRAQPELVPPPGRPHLEESPPADEPPGFASRNWRAEAWDRERERELRSSNRKTGTSARRRSGS